MGYAIKQIGIASLLLDQANPRLPDVQPNQQAMQLALANLVGDQVINIAEDIAENGLDPMTLLAVVKDDSARGRFRVLEGNRRLLALKALDTPGIIDSVLTSSRRKRLNEASRAYKDDPISSVRCVVFDTPEDAWYWIELRHTGENEGIGLVSWGTNEQDRFRSRHGRSAKRQPAGQVLDFVDAILQPHEGANSKILTNLKRLISTRYVREKLGIETDQGTVYTWYPAPEIFKSLSKAVHDLRSTIKVGHIYYEQDRIKYIDTYGPSDLPDPATRLPARIELTSLPTSFAPDTESGSPTEQSSHKGAQPQPAAPADSGKDSATPPPAGRGSGDGAAGAGADGPTAGSTQLPAGSPGGGTPRSRARPRADRDTVIPRGVALFIPEARINVVHEELRTLPIETYVNACAVLFRVFVELSIDAYIARNQLMTEQERRNQPLGKRLKTAAGAMKTRGEIDAQLEKAVIRIADSSGPLGTSTTTFNQYVHNTYVFPRPSELRIAWDELEPVLLQIWKR